MARADARTAEASRPRRSRRRRRPPVRYGRFLRLTFVGSLIPGVGLFAAGKRALGGFILTVFLLFLALAGVVFVQTPKAELASYGGDREMLLYAGAGLTALAVIWLWIALASHRSLEPDGLSAGKRFAGSLMVILAASVVVAPMAVAARNAFTQRDVIGAISGDDETSMTVPVDIDKEDPWKNIPRVNILLLGGDTGLGRDEDELGIRPDTQIVASIDTKTGDTTLISLPRNLGNVPFPDDSPLQAYYPYGFDGSGDPADWILNAVYNNAPALHPDLNVTGADANKWAVEGALGINIDYYMMVNLDGFAAIVDALGGVTIDVGEPVPIHYGEPDSYCTYRASYIESGEHKMTGSRALMYARSRCNSDNYERMARQQCVIEAIIDEARPNTLLTQYQSLASATKNMVKTDIPADLFPAIIRLALEVQKGELDSISLNTDFFAEHGGSAATPDYEVIHAAIAEALNPDVTTNDGTGSTDDPTSESPTDADESSTAGSSESTTGGTNEGDPGLGATSTTTSEPEESESPC